MFSIAALIERAKLRANIDTDYRLAKVIQINQSAIGNYRAGRSLPDERVLEQLCALSGDDLAVFAAQIQGERARTPEGKTMWKMIAARLAGGAGTAILSVAFSIGLIAVSPDTARASGLISHKTPLMDSLHIVSTSVFVSACTRLERLRWRTQGLPGLFRLCALSWC